MTKQLLPVVAPSARPTRDFSEQGILAFGELPCPYSKKPVRVIQVPSGARPEVIYGVIDGISAGLKACGPVTGKARHDAIADLFIEYACTSLMLEVIPHVDREPLGQLERLWSPIGYGIYAFDSRGKCASRATDRWPAGYGSPSLSVVHGEFMHIVRTLSTEFLQIRTAAYDWTYDRMAELNRPDKRERFNEIRNLIKHLDATGTAIANSGHLTTAIEKLKSPPVQPTW